VTSFEGIAGYHSHLTCPSSRHVNIAELRDPNHIALDRRGKQDHAPGKVNVFDDPEPQTAAGCVCDEAKQIALEASGQTFAVRRQRAWCADDQDAIRASLGVNCSLEFDRCAGSRVRWKLSESSESSNNTALD